MWQSFWWQVHENRKEQTLQENKEKLEKANEKVEAEVTRFKEKERRQEEKKILEVKRAYMQADENEETLNDAKSNALEVELAWKQLSDELKEATKPVHQKEDLADKMKSQQTAKTKESRETMKKYQEQKGKYDAVDLEILQQKDEKKRLEKDAKVNPAHVSFTFHHHA